MCPAFKYCCFPAPVLKTAGNPILRRRSGTWSDEEPGAIYGELFSDGSVSKHLRNAFYKPNEKMVMGSCPQGTFWLTLKLVRTQGRI